jgi:hypothetical protein
MLPVPSSLFPYHCPLRPGPLSGIVAVLRSLQYTQMRPRGEVDSLNDLSGQFRDLYTSCRRIRTLGESESESPSAR